jgi:predicted nuclease with TOPRIM domain
MKTMRESWTDERLDDGFDRVDADLRAIHTEVSSFRVETSERFDRLEGRVGDLGRRFDRWEVRSEAFEERFATFEARFERFEDRFDRWQRLTVSMFGGMMIALLGIVLSHA